LSPAIFCRPPLIRDIPYRNIPREPNSVSICKNKVINLKSNILTNLVKIC
jgi:hypothetical protein